LFDNVPLFKEYQGGYGFDAKFAGGDRTIVYVAFGEFDLIAE